jgi:hypothetical protein
VPRGGGAGLSDAMALERVAVKPSDEPLPERVAAFVLEANRRIDTFYETRWKKPIIAFVPSDLEATWRTLATIFRDKLAHGRSFCEWGCGFAAVAGVASLAGFQACGIEIERTLVDEARKLARDANLAVEIVHGNFVPADAGELGDCNVEFTWLAEGGPDGHDALGLDPRDFDVVFAYPWPGEERVIHRLFDAYAEPGALLVTYHGKDGLRVQRKVAGARRTKRAKGRRG